MALRLGWRSFEVSEPLPCRRSGDPDLRLLKDPRDLALAPRRDSLRVDPIGQSANSKPSDTNLIAQPLSQ